MITRPTADPVVAPDPLEPDPLVPDSLVAAGSAPPAVELTGLRKTYGVVRAVDGLDLTIASGEIVAVLGPNGAGKSTVTEMLLGIVAPDAGTVRVFGADPATALRTGRVGAMLQDGALLDDASVRDLLRLMHGLHVHPLPLDQVIERADLGALLRMKTDKLSGGQAQRVRYALAIMADPSLLILDEPTVGMDVEVRRAFWSSMRDFTGDGRTVLFATHYLDEADLVADRIVVLAGGRVVADGTGTQIKARVAGRTISLAADGVTRTEIAGLPGVVRVDQDGARLRIHAPDSDTVLRALLARFPDAREVEVASAKLEDAFLPSPRPRAS